MIEKKAVLCDALSSCLQDFSLLPGQRNGIKNNSDNSFYLLSILINQLPFVKFCVVSMITYMGSSESCTIPFSGTAVPPIGQ